MMRFALFLSFFLLASAQAWPNSTYLWFYDQVNPDACTLDMVAYNASLEARCDYGDLVELANTTDICRTIANLSHIYLCLQMPPVECPKKFDEFIAKYFDKFKTFEDCGIIFSKEQFDSYIVEFEVEMQRDEPFMGWTPVNWLKIEEIEEYDYNFTEEPTARGSYFDEGAGNSEYHSFTAGYLIAKPFSTLFLSSLFGIPTFFVWELLLFALLLWIFHGFVYSSAGEQTYADSQNKRLFGFLQGGTYENQLRAWFSLSLKWLLGISAGILVLSLILEFL